MMWLIIILTWVLSFGLISLFKRLFNKPVGGMSVFLSFSLGYIFLVLLNELPFHPVLITTISLIFITGLIDDFIHLKPIVKLVAQFGIAALFIQSDIAVVSFGGVLGIWELDPIIKWIFNLILISGLINAINQMDSIEGLLGGFTSINLVLFSLFFFFFGPHLHWVISLLFLVALFAFFVYKLFPSRILIGDCGSLIIGTLLSFLALELYDIQRPNLAYYGFYNILPIIFSALILPVYDTIKVLILRLAHHRNPFKGDGLHYYSTVKGFGKSNHKAAFSLYATQLLLVIAGICLSMTQIDLVISLVLLIGLNVLFIELKMFKKLFPVA